MIRKILLTLFSFLIFTVTVYAENATEIIRKSEEAVRGNSQISRIEIIIKTRRWTRKLELKSWENRLEKKSFSEITAPRKDAGNRFLLINQDMRQYVPKLKKDIKISPSMMLQAWMGSDFTNDDIVKESSITKDYFHSLEKEEKVDGHSCYKLILKPRPDAAVVWGKIVYYARKGDYLPVREEFYNEHGKMKKIMTCGNFRKMHDRVIPTDYKMQTVGKKDRYTRMIIRAVKFNQTIPASVFTLQNLKRR
ncbi:MAG TPA: outer membrane lipoprotein-sorting protein [Spirochaetota bacterium]|nr:outer membrane lipoprotein-sorting protein [Spirochaetota bacterium]HPJ33981.1 outer membrane lipoprotein-sorting protein [Spirochaetota bacterium]